ncbi:9696_t:CDS:2 [Funneliformis geosporum]|uniref:9696_t:CDS:1 n=1 Tax=Funneliformis geosporum TaxID=1117311 RepID=A0A9W4T2N5_9GLOM|nr:9696_t:CDS:2 [Funneliformis geosporum]
MVRFKRKKNYVEESTVCEGGDVDLCEEERSNLDRLLFST